MMPLLLRKGIFSFKKEAFIILGVLVTLLLLPCIAVFSVTNVNALVGSGPDGGSGNNAALYTGPASTDDMYTWGNCTYWVFLLRQKAGDPIPNTWGNAATWAFYAQLDGYVVNQTPSVGAIMQISTVDNGLGHVAYVTGVNPKTGVWTISEMNVKGLDIVDTQSYPASAAIDFNFIHDKEH